MKTTFWKSASVASICSLAVTGCSCICVNDAPAARQESRHGTLEPRSGWRSVFSVTRLLRVAADETENPIARVSAIDLIGDLQMDHALPSLLRMLARPPDYLMIHLLVAISRYRDPAALPELLRLRLRSLSPEWPHQVTWNLENAIRSCSTGR